MATVVLDTMGLVCPQPVLKIAVKIPEMNRGDILEVVGDCDTLEKDIRNWCERMKKVVLSVKNEGGKKRRVQIQL